MDLLGSERMFHSLPCELSPVRGSLAGPLSPLLPLCPSLATRPLDHFLPLTWRRPGLLVLAGQWLLLPSGWMLCSQPLAQAKGPWVPGSAELNPPIWQMRKLRPGEGKRRVQGHPGNPVVFSVARCLARRGDPQTLALTLQKWRNLDLSDRRVPG